MPITISGQIVVGPGGGGNPNAPQMLVGTTSYDWNGFGSPAAVYADTESRVGGALGCRRIYDGGVATNWTATMSGGIDIGKRVTWYSCKPNMANLALGSGAAYTSEVGRINTLLDSMTTGTSVGHKFILTFGHEPENDAAYMTTQGKQDYRNGWAVANALTQARNTSTTNPQFKTCMVYMGYSFQTASGREVLDWWPGDANVDIAGVDSYNTQANNAAQKWNSFFRGLSFPVSGETTYAGGLSHGGFHQFAFDHGKPIAVGEWGTVRNHNAGTPQWCVNAGISGSKDDYMKFAADQLIALGNQPNSYPRCIALAYFNTYDAAKVWSGSNESWGLYEGLPSDDSYDALAYINNKYGLPNLVGEPAWPF